MCCGNKNGDKSNGSGQKRQGDLKFNKKQKKFAKIVLLGNVAVGKTSITQRYCYEKFEEKYYNTLGGAYVEKNVILKNNEVMQLNIWDTAGDERYSIFLYQISKLKLIKKGSIMPLYYRDATAAILVYDVTDMNSFRDLSYWIEELDQKVKTEGMIIFLVGNKNDVSEEEKRVTTATADSFAREKNLLFGECSAKSGEGIEKVFSSIIDEYLKNLNKK